MRFIRLLIDMFISSNMRDIHLGLTNDFPPCPVVCLVEDDAPVNRTEDLGTVDGDANTLGFGSIWICGSSRRVIK